MRILCLSCIRDITILLHLGGVLVPWHIEKKEGKHCIVKTSSDEIKHCYPNRHEALKYLRALYANTQDEKETKKEKE